jgi:hypothetical protein
MKNRMFIALFHNACQHPTSTPVWNVDHHPRPDHSVNDFAGQYGMLPPSAQGLAATGG